MSVQRLIAIALLVAVVPIGAYAAVGALHAQPQLSTGTPSNNRNSSLSISASGNSSVIGKSSTATGEQHAGQHATGVASAGQSSNEKATTPGASVQITATIVHSTNGTITFNVTGTSLVIGSTTYTVDNGTGIFNQHSMVVVVQATVSTGSTTGHLVLKGTATPSSSTVEGGAGGYSVSFTDPQSKLAGSFFLSLDGTLTISK